MGGGGAMRVVSKVTGFAVNGGLRGAPSVHLTDQSVTNCAVKKSSRSVSAIVSSSSSVNEDGKSAVLISSQNGKIDATESGVQRPSWEIDDWEFAGDDEELILDSLNPIPRVVFGGVPTLEEAEEATSELKDALEKCGCRLGSSETFVRSWWIFVMPLRLQLWLPGHGLEAALLQLVTSGHGLWDVMIWLWALMMRLVVSGCGLVYNAVMQNEKVMEFFQSQKISAHPNVMNIDVNEPLVETLFQNQESSVKIEDMSEAKHSESSGNGFKGFVHNIKLTVVEMVKNLSGFFQNIFGDPAAENVPGDANRNAKETYVDSVVGASSFMALAVLVIMVIFLKRG
ncbi:hypothetical protein HHK36_003463 [Tetracentron sinense]|uniref:Uncharacterized protein n=1 Tax=Tetracentron sinense TaxID=13715 RepID=A0A835DPC6_TETSI|nr:hypothetical protein HHK36_003463 [Tetracentron sinense]